MYGTVTTMDVEATSYCWQDTSKMTASGRSACLPMGCAAPPDVPFGSVVIVKEGPWAGRYTVDDRGDAIHGNRIDLRLKDHATCVQFGRRRLLCEIRYYTRESREPVARGEAKRAIKPTTTERPRKPAPVVKTGEAEARRETVDWPLPLMASTLGFAAGYVLRGRRIC